MKRESWSSRLGFTIAAIGSAVGLVNIWRFPYVVGEHGGGAFIIVYLICLALIGLPVFISETLIGRTTQTSPVGAFRQLGKNRWWEGAGKMIVLTGFIVSSFYSVVAGWMVGYLIEAIGGGLTHFQSVEEAGLHYHALRSSPFWGIGFHFLFIALCLGMLYTGVRRGIELGNKIAMPLLFFLLVVLAVRGLFLPNAMEGLNFAFKPNWSLLTPAAILTALGHSFFTLSLGQGTMITYGSYMSKKDGIVQTALPIVLADTAVSLLAAVAVMTTVFSVGMPPDSGPSLVFQTLPIVFGQVTGGYLLAILFFLLVVLAALTSEISAIEPAIAYLIDEKKWPRHKAVLVTGLGAFVIGIPSALSFSLLKDCTFFGWTFFDAVSFIATDVMIPIGGFLAVMLIAWRWGVKKAWGHLEQGASKAFTSSLVKRYFWFCWKYVTPVLIVLIFLHQLGVFNSFLPN